MYLVVYILDQPKRDSLYCIALLLELCQQVYVGRTGGMQGSSDEEVSLLELFLQRKDLSTAAKVLMLC